MVTLEQPTRAEQIMDEIHTILAMRQSLTHVPGTHAKRAEMLHDAADLYDQLHDARQSWPSASA